MRGTLFTIVYYILSTVYVLVSVPFLILPGHTPVRMIIRSYTRAVNMSLRLICGIRKEVRGRSNLPEGGFIVAGKHAVPGAQPPELWVRVIGDIIAQLDAEV